MRSFEGTAEITDEGVKKHFRSFEPANALFELVWNGFDAGAKSIKVVTNFNELGGLESVEVLDDGDGIDVKNLKNSFEKFNESTKKDDDDKHGSHGKGRLAFHKLCASASWYTKRNGYNAKIVINSSAIRKYEGLYLEESEQHELLRYFESGTCVALDGFENNFLPEKNKLIDEFSREFGWYLAINADCKIEIDGSYVYIPSHEMHEAVVVIDEVDFRIKVIRWDEKPGSEKSYNYLVGGKNKIISKELSKANNKVSFYTSAYAISEWLLSYDKEALEMDPVNVNSRKIVRNLFRRMTEVQREIYKDYLRRYVDQEIVRFEENGYFPSYSGMDASYASWRKENTKTVVKNIYIADPQVFNRLASKPAQILIRLLDAILVSNENDALFDVLDGVLDLSNENVERLAKQLKLSTLENIISTIEILQRRQQAIHQIREIMDHRFSEVLETPDLQKIIENNTWLFGPQYVILGAEEDTFTAIAKNLRDEVKNIDVISNEDIDSGLTVEGVNRQVDLFLARKIPTFDSNGSPLYKCVIVEIKRPGISLNKKHLQQVDDYCEILAKHPSFCSSKMVFEVILIGRKISKDDYQIRQRMDSLKGKEEFGLVAHGGKIKCYVRDWYTIFDEFELTNSYLLKNLNSNLDDLSGEKTADIVADLQGKKKEIA